jgi:hypothetical protein
MRCSKDQTNICGGTWRNSVYSIVKGEEIKCSKNEIYGEDKLSCQACQDNYVPSQDNLRCVIDPNLA